MMKPRKTAPTALYSVKGNGRTQAHIVTNKVRLDKKPENNEDVAQREVPAAGAEVTEGGAEDLYVRTVP